jgi:hypothetical protein
MSFYVLMQCQVEYPSQESFDTVVEMLQAGHWMDSDGYFIDEDKNRITQEPNIDRQSLSLCIPCSHYRNLSYLDIFMRHGVKGTVAWTSSDGCFTGYSYEDGQETTYDLNTWALENMDGDDRYPPKKEEYNSQDDFDQNLFEWRQLVEREFHDEFVVE